MRRALGGLTPTARLAEVVHQPQHGEFPSFRFDFNGDPAISPAQGEVRDCGCVRSGSTSLLMRNEPMPFARQNSSACLSDTAFCRAMSLSLSIAPFRDCRAICAAVVLRKAIGCPAKMQQRPKRG